MNIQKATWALVTAMVTALLAFAPAATAQDNAQPALSSDPKISRRISTSSAPMSGSRKPRWWERSCS